MAQVKPTSKVVKVEQTEITQPTQPEPPITVSVRVNNPEAIAYAVASGIVGAVLDRFFGKSNSDQ